MKDNKYDLHKNGGSNTESDKMDWIVRVTIFIGVIVCCLVIGW